MSLIGTVTQKQNGANISHLAEGNRALREKNYPVAIARYLEALQETPALGKVVSFNMAQAKQRYRQSRNGVDRQRVAVCGWELSHNAAGRVYTLAQLYQTFADTEIIGSFFPKWGRELWEPIRGTSIPVHSFVVEDEKSFLDQAVQLVVAHPYDIVHLSKPRISNIFIGILYKLIWDAKVLVDIDDEELAFVGADIPISIDEYITNNGSLPALINLPGKDWTRLAVGLAKEFDGVTVSNPALQQRYGGEIIRHARDEKLFNPTPELKRKSREKFGIPQDKKVVIFFGTPREHKGLLETADAIASLECSDVVFAIVGDFPTPELKVRLQGKKGVDYFFLGNQPFDKIPDVLAIADYCVLLQDPDSPVTQFQVPAKLSDALGMGLVVLASSSMPLQEMIEKNVVIAITNQTLPRVLKTEIENSTSKPNNLRHVVEFFKNKLSNGANIHILQNYINFVENNQSHGVAKLFSPKYYESDLKILNFLGSAVEIFLSNNINRPNKLNIANNLTHDVIICIHNAPADVKLCLDSILKNKEDVDKIILIDDFSDKETKDILTGYNKLDNIYIINTIEQLGYTKSANIGLKASNAKIRTLLNSDTIVTSNWAAKIIKKFIENPELGIVGPLSNAASHQSVPNIVGSGTQTAINGIPDDITIEEMGKFCEEVACEMDLPYVPLVHGFCMSITSECLERTGYFDEVNFPKGYGEENDFCIRAGDAGYALGIALDTYIYHAKSKSYKSEQRIKLMEDGWRSLVEKHGKMRLVNAIKVMENQPSLIYMRDAFNHRFYGSCKEVSSNKALMEDRNFELKGKKIKSIAFYLPQFHPIPENDKNWGEGFTEWTNVVKARPRFPGHFQPRLPGKFGFYDLRLPSVMAEQAALAKKYGVTGFCFYYYRFGNKRVLDLPLQNYLANREANLPFCYCWANESWTRAWDGKTSDVLFQQTYDDDTFFGYIEDLVVAINDSRYICIDGKPLILIYQVAEIPEPAVWVRRMRDTIRAKIGREVVVGSVFSPGFQESMLEFLDFVVQFPPHRIPRKSHRVTIERKKMEPYDLSKEDYYESYDEVVNSALRDSAMIKKMLLGVCPDWDNSARRKTKATTLVGSTPQKFGSWVRQVSRITEQKYRDGEIPAPVFFINAWNEWAEGAVLEPTEMHGYTYLEEFKHSFT